MILSELNLIIYSYKLLIFNKFNTPNAQVQDT